MSRPHSRILVRRFEDCSHARCTPPSWATESSPYSMNTRSYSSSARRNPDGRVDREIAGEIEIGDELVEEQPPQALVGTRIAREERALHDLGQVHQGEHRLVEIREVRPEHGRFL